MDDLTAMRTDYDTEGLDIGDLDPEPMAQLRRWLDEAVEAGVPEPNAMTVATASRDGVPSARVLLVKGLDRNGLVFYTNYVSRKGREFEQNPRAAACLVWLDMHRQARLEGTVERVSPEESDAYFSSRPRGAQLAASVSRQSEVVADRATLDAAFERLEQASEGVEIERPPWWGGYRLRPEVVEFWQGRAERLHDRFRYRRQGDDWVIERLWP